MFLSLLGIEIRKTLKHPALWIGLGLLVLLLTLIVVSNHAQIKQGYQPAIGGLEQDLLSGLIDFNWIGMLICAVTGSVIAAFDYPDRSIQLWLTHGVPRLCLLLARLVIILLFGLLLVTLSYGATLVISVISRLIFFGAVETTNLNWAALPMVILCVFTGAIPYLVLTQLFAIISRSPLFAAAGTILFGTVVEPLALDAGSRYPQIVQFLPGRLANIVKSYNYLLDHAAPKVLHTDIMTIPQAVLAIFILSVLMSGISIIIFSRQDLGG